VPILYVGPQPVYDGLDQVNIPFPISLRFGRGGSGLKCGRSNVKHSPNQYPIVFPRTRHKLNRDRKEASVRNISVASLPRALRNFNRALLPAGTPAFSQSSLFCIRSYSGRSPGDDIAIRCYGTATVVVPSPQLARGTVFGTVVQCLLLRFTHVTPSIRIAEALISRAISNCTPGLLVRAFHLALNPDLPAHIRVIIIVVAERALAIVQATAAHRGGWPGRFQPKRQDHQKEYQRFCSLFHK